MLDLEFENKMLNNIYHRAKWFKQRDTEIQVTWNVGDIMPNVLIGKVSKLEEFRNDKHIVMVESDSSKELSPVQFENKSIRLSIRDVIEIKEFM